MEFIKNSVKSKRDVEFMRLANSIRYRKIIYLSVALSRKSFDRFPAFSFVQSERKEVYYIVD